MGLSVWERAKGTFFLDGKRTSVVRRQIDRRELNYKSASQSQTFHGSTAKERESTERAGWAGLRHFGLGASERHLLLLDRKIPMKSDVKAQNGSCMLNYSSVFQPQTFHDSRLFRSEQQTKL